MERWCETAAAVVNGWRHATTPVQAAVDAVRWQQVVPDLAQGASDAAARTSAGSYDSYFRRLPHFGGANVR